MAIWGGLIQSGVISFIVGKRCSCVLSAKVTYSIHTLILKKNSCTQKVVSDFNAIGKEDKRLPGTSNDDNFRQIWAIFIELHI